MRTGRCRERYIDIVVIPCIDASVVDHPSEGGLDDISSPVKVLESDKLSIEVAKVFPMRNKEVDASHAQTMRAGALSKALLVITRLGRGHCLLGSLWGVRATQVAQCPLSRLWVFYDDSPKLRNGPRCFESRDHN